MIVSFLPPKLLKIVNFLGFKGIREVAFNELNKAIELPGIYGLIGEMVVILYWLYIEMHGCLGPTNVDAMRTLIDKKMAQYPNVRTRKTRIAKFIPKFVFNFRNRAFSTRSQRIN